MIGLKMTPEEIAERVRERCNACGGTMQYMPSWHVDERDAVECMMCQRSNSEPITIAELQRKLPKYTGPKLRKGRPPGNFNRARAAKDADYKKVLNAIAGKTLPFITSSLAPEIGLSSGKVGSMLRRAFTDGKVRKVGDAGCGDVVIWEAIPEAQKATA